MQFVKVRVTAEVVMLSSEQGGRTKPLLSGYDYRPNHNLWPDREGEPEFVMGIMTFAVNSERIVGDAVEADVQFIVPEEIASELRTGRVWQIQEAATIVGHGKILSVTASTPIT